MKNKCLAILVALIALVMASPAFAGLITINVGGMGSMSFPADTTPPGNAPWRPNGYPGDTVAWVQPSREVMASFVVTSVPASVPDSGATLALLGGALMGRGARRREFRS